MQRVNVILWTRPHPTWSLPPEYSTRVHVGADCGTNRGNCGRISSPSPQVLEQVVNVVAGIGVVFGRQKCSPRMVGGGIVQTQCDLTGEVIQCLVMFRRWGRDPMQ